MISLPFLDIDTPFPSPSTALTDPDGLLAYGADLSVPRLFNAYSQGIFPWFSDGEPILWWSPEPRAIIELENFHVSKSLSKLIKQKKFRVSLNCAFLQVIKACASIPRAKLNGEGTSTDTWITKDMQQAYLDMHKMGLAHSVEIWHQDALVGGLYGIGIGEVFCGESMFHTMSNTSKLAMNALVTHMKANNMAFIDCQLPTEHLMSLGATSVSREQFLSRLAQHNTTLDEEGYLLPAYEKIWQPQMDMYS